MEKNLKRMDKIWKNKIFWRKKKVTKEKYEKIIDSRRVLKRKKKNEYEKNENIYENKYR